ncbi:MAG: sulfatase [Planctomycetaceae bacterium]|nr:sulfatase [Planctomycetaceae bacterium]|tara:strand:- start:1518 stop:2921 length:1404 start_codon:yes stop_codon:yes gene_type:complete
MQRRNLLHRRNLLQRLSAGLGTLALSGFLTHTARQATGSSPLAMRKTHFVPRAKRVIVLFMFGGPSHLDSFDPKPQLTRHHGQPLPFQAPRVLSFPLRHGNLVGSPFRFQRHGESGTWISDRFPHLAKRVDDLCVVNSMHCSNSRHGGAVLEWHTGTDTFIRPSLGSWMTYGLGSENQDLPGYITICQALSQGGANNFGSAFLPAAFQGTPLGSGGVAASEALIPFIRGKNPRHLQQLELEMLQKMAATQRQQSGPDPQGAARLASFELALRMQNEAPLAQDLASESAATHQLYGLNDPDTEDFGRQCLMARRFAERGVRFVQCNSNGWDHHSQLEQGMTSMCRAVDQPIAGLLTDLKQRGMLDETLVIWGGEFGRTPTAENANGRDHNPHGFSVWMAGGGVRAGLTYGQTDDYGYYAVENKVHFHDLHATILHLMGLDHQRLTFRYAGRDFRLTDVHGEVVHDLLA